MDDDQADRFANELRNIIGKIPNLSVFIDEVHHAQAEEIKLRSVVTNWAEKESVCSVIGFSGTPYLQPGEKTKVNIDKISIKNQEINNVVYYYPLVKGITNFLKTPKIISYEDRNNYLEIVDQSLRMFLNAEKNHIYPNGTCSKVAIYLTSIEQLEENAYPFVIKVCEEYGMDPSESILKYYSDSNKNYSISKEAEIRFEQLDTYLSKVRIILLVGIGREGWDCKSLTSVILPQGSRSSSKTYVLQTCCRALRQVTKNEIETAYIFLSKSNEEFLAEQLYNEQRATIAELQESKESSLKRIRFYNRMDELNVPEIVYYQMNVDLKIVEEEISEPAKNIAHIPLDQYRFEYKVAEKSIDGRILNMSAEDVELGSKCGFVANFTIWLLDISKRSLNTISFEQLSKHEGEIRTIFDKITFEEEGIKYFSTKFDLSGIESAIRLSYSQKRRTETIEVICPDVSSLLSPYKFEREEIVKETEMNLLSFPE
jgi:hypothetical protein